MIEIEICVESRSGIEHAAVAGATRVELCSALEMGGLTPSIAMVEDAVNAELLPVHPIVRPRAGDFCYEDAEFEIALQDLAHFRAIGVAGVVFGCLKPDGDLDRDGLARFRDAAGSLDVTFHRAIDVAREPIAILEELIDLVGVTRVLTSGQAAAAGDGLEAIKRLVGAATGRIEVMAGGGLTPETLTDVCATGVQAVHFSASRYVDGPMRHFNPAVQASAAGFNENRRRITCPERLEQMIGIVRTYDRTSLCKS